MGGSTIGKIIYFWIFILGGLFAAKLLGFADNAGNLIKILVMCGIVFAVFTVVWGRIKVNRKSDAASNDNNNNMRAARHKKKKRKK